MLAAAIRRLLDEPALAADLARQGRLKAMTTFSLHTFLAGIDRVISDVHHETHSD